ncbi:hypothetical protein BGZ94_002743 [Podila epigama]|nr:hypothetical protein BGZ94_002743 [Podila epigama]
MAEFLPQLIEFATQLDLQRVIVTQTTLCILGAIRNVPAYNIPLLFFGLYAYQHHDSVEPLQQFAGFTALSMLADITWLLLIEGIGFGEIITIILLVSKPLTLISSLQLLKFRGDPFSSLGGGMDWSLGQHGNNASRMRHDLAYQSLADDVDDDAQEINIPRHSCSRLSQQSGSFMTTSTTNSSRSNSLRSGRTSSTHGGIGQLTQQHAQQPHASHADDHSDKVGQAGNSVPDDDADLHETGRSSGHQDSRATGESGTRTGYQPF